MSDNKLKVGDTIRCRDWEDLKKTVKDITAAGYTCEVKGWEQMQTNTFTITGIPEVEA